MPDKLTADEREQLAREQTEQAYLDLGYLIEQWPRVVTLSVPGTRKRWVQSERRTAVIHEQLAAKALDGVKGVPRAAAADVNVLTICADYADIARDLFWDVMAVRSLPRQVFAPAVAVTVDPSEYLEVVRVHLWDTHDADPKFGPRVHRRIARLVPDVARMLGDIRDGQTLAGICPWCHGRTASGLGEPTIHLYYPPQLGDEEDAPFDPNPDKPTPPPADGKKDPDPLFVCHGLNCSPPSTAYGLTHEGKPAWPIREWDWLAKQLNTPHQRRTA